MEKKKSTAAQFLCNWVDEKLFSDSVKEKNGTMLTMERFFPRIDVNHVMDPSEGGDCKRLPLLIRQAWSVVNILLALILSVICKKQCSHSTFWMYFWIDLALEYLQDYVYYIQLIPQLVYVFLSLELPAIILRVWICYLKYAAYEMWKQDMTSCILIRNGECWRKTSYAWSFTWIFKLT